MSHAVYFQLHTVHIINCSAFTQWGMYRFRVMSYSLYDNDVPLSECASLVMKRKSVEPDL